MSALQLIASRPDVVGSLDQRLGILAITLSCWAPDIRTAISGSVPDFGLTGLIEWQPRRFMRSSAGDVGGYEVEVTVEGHLNPDGAEDEFYELEGTTFQKSVEEHWNFSVLLSTYGAGKKPGKDGRMVWPLQLRDEGGETRRNPMAGVESYDEPGLIWTRNWVASRLPTTIVSDLGTIFDTPPGNPPEVAQPPGVSDDRKWICVRTRGRQRGNIWHLATSYQLTGPHGAIPEMYPHR